MMWPCNGQLLMWICSWVKFNGRASPWVNFHEEHICTDKQSHVFGPHCVLACQCNQHQAHLRGASMTNQRFHLSNAGGRWTLCHVYSQFEQLGHLISSILCGHKCTIVSCWWISQGLDWGIQAWSLDGRYWYPWKKIFHASFVGIVSLS